MDEKNCEDANNLSYFTRAMFGKTSKVAYAVGAAAVVVTIITFVGWAVVGAAVICGICGIAITTIQQHEETERVKQKEQTEREKQKEQTKREKQKEQTKEVICCFAIFALCFFMLCLDVDI